MPLPQPAAPQQAADAKRAGGEAGFTLLEILVVIAIIGLLIGLVAPAVLRQFAGAKLSIAHQSIARLGSVLDLYKLDTGDYPTTEQGLQALITDPGSVSGWNGPYVQSGRLPLDPWNHPFIYRDPSNHAGTAYDLCSAGPNAQAGGQAGGAGSGGAGEICNP
ncbi:MAG TPA: type II secretion system major pseudopilin GspG [Acetobacteraceae bacterium]|nr:type II secretion system major pseudopilin GspG [Acetobacteraceae bacterium]